MSCQGHKIKSAVLIRLLTQTLEAPKKRNRIEMTNAQKKKRKRMVVSKKEINNDTFNSYKVMLAFISTHYTALYID